MKTASTSAVLFLNDETPICCYCGNMLQVTSYIYEINRTALYKTIKEYECNCEKWNLGLEVNSSLAKLNGTFHKQYQTYKENFDKLSAAGIKIEIKKWHMDV